MVSAKESWAVFGSYFCWETVQRKCCNPSFWKNLGWLPGSPCLSLGSSALPSWSCPALGHLPSLLVTLRVLPGIPLAAQLSRLISFSVQTRQGRMETWKMSLHSWEAQRVWELHHSWLLPQTNPSPGYHIPRLAMQITRDLGLMKGTEREKVTDTRVTNSPLSHDLIPLVFSCCILCQHSLGVLGWMVRFVHVTF